MAWLTAYRSKPTKRSTSMVSTTRNKRRRRRKRRESSRARFYQMTTHSATTGPSHLRRSNTYRLSLLKSLRMKVKLSKRTWEPGFKPLRRTTLGLKRRAEITVRRTMKMEVG